MNTIAKIILVLLGAVLLSVGLFYMVFKMPASPGPLMPPPPAGEPATPTDSANPTVPAGGGGSKSSAGGAYAELLGEADTENAFYAPEDIDTAYLTAESAEISAVGRVYDEIALPPFSNFCKSLTDTKVNYISAIEARGKIVDAARTKAAGELETKRKARDDSKNSLHANLNSTRDSYITRLGALSKNPSLKYKVDVYAKAISDAVFAKREAVKSAVDLFRQGIGQVFLAKNKLIDSAIINYKISAQAAFDRALSSCNSGVITLNIRTGLESELKIAHDKFINDQVAAEKMAASIQPLIIQRKAAFTQVISTFKSAMTSARTQFKSAFPHGE